ncbi:hypothetical protein [Tabrizicola sp. BL-A-41-H6]
MPDLPIGALLRILSNHACPTAAEHEQYETLPAAGELLQAWPRFGGW